MKYVYALLSFALMSAVLAQPPSDLTQDPTFKVALTWNKPTMNTDGSALGNLAGYIIYYHTTARPAGCLKASQCATWASGVKFVRVTNPLLQTIDITNAQGLLPKTQYFFSATAYNTSSIESDYSNEASATTPDVTKPGAPSSVGVNITFPVVL